MTTPRPPARRRRRRRGSAERPVNGRLYRACLLLVALPLLVAAFAVARPRALPAPQLPPAFDEGAARNLADELATRYPDRRPGSAGALGAATWFRDQMRPYALVSHTDAWRERVAGLGRVRLENLTSIAIGQSRDAIVVVAHRDDSGIGPGANDNASGTAALVELARAYARSGPADQRVRSVHTIVFLSTDGGAYGALGALRFAERTRFHVTSVVDLDAIAGLGRPRIAIAGDAPRSPAATLLETAAHRIVDQAGVQPRRPGVVAQLVDLGFPFSLHEQAPFVARGIPALTLSTGGERPPDELSDTASRLRSAKLAAIGRAAQELVGSLDGGLEFAQGTASYVWLGDRIVRGWAIQLVLLALLVPFLVVTVDLFARCRRRRIPLGPAVASLRARLGFWLVLGLLFYAFDLAGAWPHGAARPPSPAAAVAGDWPSLALFALAGLGMGAWLLARARLVPRRAIELEEQVAGETVALLGLGVVSLLVLATNPFALVFVLPAAHAWVWLPQVRTAPLPVRAAVFLVGLAGPLLVVWSLGVRYGLGLDAPWYLLLLTALGYVQLPAVAIALAGAACASQLAAASTGRYAPYPDPDDRGPYGPIRSLVRGIALGIRSRRRVSGRGNNALTP